MLWDGRAGSVPVAGGEAGVGGGRGRALRPTRAGPTRAGPTRAGPTRAGPGAAAECPLDPPAGAAAVYVSCVFAPRRAGGPAAPPRPRAGTGRPRARAAGCRTGGCAGGGRRSGLARPEGRRPGRLECCFRPGPVGVLLPARPASGPAGKQAARPVGVLLLARPGPLPPTELKGSVGGRIPKPRCESGRPAYPAGPGRAGPVTGLASSCGCRRALPADPVLWSLDRGSG